MVNATRRPDAHLETVIEFEMEPEPVGAPAPVLGERAMHVRRFVVFAGVAVGVLLAAVVRTGIATAPAPSSGPKAFESPAAVSACRHVDAPQPDGVELVRWCSWPAPTSPSAELAVREARDAAVARGRVWAQTHGPGSAAYHVWSPDEPAAQAQRMGSP